MQRTVEATRIGLIRGTGVVTVVLAGDREPAREFGGPLLSDILADDAAA